MFFFFERLQCLFYEKISVLTIDESPPFKFSIRTMQMDEFQGIRHVEPRTGRQADRQRLIVARIHEEGSKVGHIIDGNILFYHRAKLRH